MVDVICKFSINFIKEVVENTNDLFFEPMQADICNFADHTIPHTKEF